jgi:uncharacterized protein (DUF2235 family)
MMKNIVFCADGTWDKTNNKTNVYRLYKALPTTAGQLPFYDDGVGTNGLAVDRLLGGAFGVGLFQKIKEGYTRIAHIYEKDDDIFLFGFSRGAYTARSLAGMIAVCGLPTQNWDDNFVDTAFEAYRNKDQRESLLAKLKDCGMYNAKLKMVGVWDTVGSLGIPAVFGGIDIRSYTFLDTSLHENVLNAYHALAIDERRCEFPATLWNAPFKPSQTVEQVWFCGVHSDVGGGYPAENGASQGLTDITLGWMMSKACALGLNVNRDVQNQYAVPLDAKYALDTLHESWNPLWGFPSRRTIDAKASIADSVIIRCQHHDGWQPKNLELQNGMPASHYTIERVVMQPIAAAAPGTL